MSSPMSATPALTKEHRYALFGALLSGAHDSNSDTPLTQRWARLEAAHVVGQHDFGLQLAALIRDSLQTVRAQSPRAFEGNTY